MQLTGGGNVTFTFTDKAGTCTITENASGNDTFICTNLDTTGVDGTQFTVISGSDVLEIMQNLESYITTVDSTATGGQATIDTRLSTLVGVNGNNLETFTEGIFSDSLNIKMIQAFCISKLNSVKEKST